MQKLRQANKDNRTAQRDVLHKLPN